MNATIDKDGFLHIERAGVMKEQVCPLYHHRGQYAFDDGSVSLRNRQCGDWCPLFGEPTIQDYGDNNKVIAINLCEMGWEFDTLTDERGKQ